VNSQELPQKTNPEQDIKTAGSGERGVKQSLEKSSIFCSFSINFWVFGEFFWYYQGALKKTNDG
jgi:hypothetical protein